MCTDNGIQNLSVSDFVRGGGRRKTQKATILVATWTVEWEFIGGRVGGLGAETIDRRNFEGVLDARLDAVQNAVVDLHRAKRTRFGNIN